MNRAEKNAVKIGNIIISRRAVLFLSACCIGLSLVGSMVHAERISFIVSAEDMIAQAKPAQWALSQLQNALQIEGVETQIRAHLQDVSEYDRCVVVAGRSSRLAVTLFQQQRVEIPDVPETLGLVEGTLAGMPCFVVRHSFQDRMYL